MSEPSGRLRAVFRDGLVLAIPVVAMGALYLWTVAARRYAFPVGYDTPKYVWRTNLVGAQGLAALKGSAPQPFRVNPDRPGFPVLMSLASSVLHVSSIRALQVLPAVVGATVALAAGVAGRAAALEPLWAFPVYGLVVGGSANVARMAAPGYDDNLLLSGVVVAAAALALLSAERRRGGLGAVLLVISAVLIHWIFAAYFLVILAALALVTLPGSIRDWRNGRRPQDTASGRLAGVIGGGAVGGGAAFLALAAGEPSPPKLPGESFLAKLHSDVPRYAFAAQGPAAAVGVAALAGLPPDAPPQVRSSRRRALALFVLWAVAGGAAVGLLHLGVAVPAHRLVAFGLGVPLLIAAGISGVAGLLRRVAGRAGAVTAAVMVIAVVTGIAAIGFRAWTPGRPWMPKAQVAQAAEAGRYLSMIPGDRPIVFVVDLGGHTPLSSTALAFHVIRAGLPPSLIPRTLVYLGDPETYLQARPTLRPEPETFDQASLRHWPSVRAALLRHPVAVTMPAINRSFAAVVAAHPGWRVTPHVAIVGGPPSDAGTRPAASPPPAPTPPGTVRLVLVAVALLGFLLVAGIGWAVALGPEETLAQVALAPAFGIAVLVLSGVAAARAGLTPKGWPAAVLWSIVSVAGWIWAFVTVQRRRTTPASPEDPVVSSPEPSRR